MHNYSHIINPHFANCFGELLFCLCDPGDPTEQTDRQTATESMPAGSHIRFYMAAASILLNVILVLSDDTALFRPFLSTAVHWERRSRDTVPGASLTQCIVLCHKSPDCLVLRHYNATCELAMRASPAKLVSVVANSNQDRNVEVYVRKDQFTTGKGTFLT